MPSECAASRVPRGRCLRLPLKTAEGLGILGHFVRQKFQCDEAVQLDVLGLVDHTHPAGAENFKDAVVRNVLTDHERRAEGRGPC
jgi:hypothetical protein